MVDANSEEVQLRATWEPIDTTPAIAVNQAATQVAQSGQPGAPPEGVLLLLGHVSLPLVTAPEMLPGILEALDGRLPIAPVGKFQVSRQVAEEIVKVLQVACEQYDAALKESESHAG